MTKLIDFGIDEEVGQEVLSILEDTGYSKPEILGGLLYAVKHLSSDFEFPNPEQILDEAVVYLEGEVK